MSFRLGLLGLSGALLLGHLFRYFPDFRMGVSLILGLVAIVTLVGVAAGIAAMYINRRYLHRIDWIMGALPGMLGAIAFIGIVIIGGMI